MSDKESNAVKSGADRPGGSGRPTPHDGSARAPRPPEFEEIKPDPEEENPVFVTMPKTAQETAEEGTALAMAGAKETGGSVEAFGQNPENEYLFAGDADFNVNLRDSVKGQPTVVVQRNRENV